MSAFFIVMINEMKNPEAFSAYGAKAGATIKEHGGEIVARGQFDEILTGDLQPKAAAVVKFKDMETLKGWHTSDEYQALVPARDAAASVDISAFQVPAS
jgi:uncharacterized protein (DUF1330 family)